MSRDVVVVGVSGSLRDESYTRIGVSKALHGAERNGAETSHIDLRDMDIPLFNQDAEPTPGVRRMSTAFREADAIILGTPMYHGSYSGVLKNAIDHFGFEEFENKTVGLLVVSGGGFPLPALEHLRSVCRSLNAWVLPWEAAIPRGREVIEDGEITEAKLADRVQTLGERAVEYARIEPHQTSFESEHNVGAANQ